MRPRPIATLAVLLLLAGGGCVYFPTDDPGPFDDDDATGDDDGGDDDAGGDDDVTGDDDGGDDDAGDDDGGDDDAGDDDGGDDDTGSDDQDGDGYTPGEGDCDDHDADTYPGAPELCDGLDNDCDGALSDDEIDHDGDGQDECKGDCDDGDPWVWDGAPELCDGVNNDCVDGLPADEADADGDGWMACEGDCDDADASVFPTAPEVWNDGLDNDCDPTTPDLPTPADVGVLDLLTHRIGFAENVEGGANGLVWTVTSLADSGAGTLREAAESDDPRWIVFAVDGTIQLQSPIEVGSFTTIDARGADISIRGHGLHIHYVDDVILENLDIRDGVQADRDAISIVGSSPVWVDHCRLEDFDDGLLDIKRVDPNETMLITVSWTRFEDHDKVMLIGLQEEHAPDDENIHVTLARCYFNEVVQRQPRLCQGWAHSLNTVYRHWSSYVAASTQDARLLVEGCFFAADQTTTVFRTDLDEDAYGNTWEGHIRAPTSGQGANRVYDGAQLFENNAGNVPTPGYAYTAWDTTDCNYAQIKSTSGQHVNPAWPGSC